MITLYLIFNNIKTLINFYNHSNFLNKKLFSSPFKTYSQTEKNFALSNRSYFKSKVYTEIIFKIQSRSYFWGNTVVNQWQSQVLADQ